MPRAVALPRLLPAAPALAQGRLLTHLSPVLPACPPAAKADRLKQAKGEAEREISAFKAEREAEFRRKVCAAPSG